MPGTKRATKPVSYSEKNDDDDFVSIVDNSKKTRNAKSNASETESKPSVRQPPRKREDKITKAEEDELKLALQLSKGTIEPSLELPVIIDDKASTTSESTVSSYERETDEQDENSLPKSKRMKREEEQEEEDVDENQSSSEEGEKTEEEEEEREPTPRKKPTRKSEETKKSSEVPIVSSIDLNSTRANTRGQTKPSIPEADLSKKKSSAPTGFPTSKIVIPSVQASRVGLSRKSSAIKSLHPNLHPRLVQE